MNIYFWPQTNNKRVASYRIRCLNIVKLFEERLYGPSFYIKKPFLFSFRRPHTLILSKRYDSKSIAHAIKLKEKFGTELYLDLCDNHIFYKHETPKLKKRKIDFINAIDKIDNIITSSDYLANEISKYKNKNKIRVIEDLTEKPSSYSKYDTIFSPSKYREYKRLKSFLKSNEAKGPENIIWFGNKGTPHSGGGIDDLSLTIDILNKVYEKRPITFTVMSNSKKSFSPILERLKCPTLYIEWNLQFSSDILSLHDTCIIPIKKTPFTLSKSSNRVLTALSHGLNVIADPIPSYKKYQEFITIGVDYENLKYSAKKTRQRGDIDKLIYLQNKRILDDWQKIFINE
ncbi:hypothetical protein [Marinobacterium litorale]|uniref:hypothetical protein n=1 Tax=Marinobacterium litorale TaxID=404770 RepID=UPI0004191E97|nr:hypothetical protein [Marinobacterium litorale]